MTQVNIQINSASVSDRGLSEKRPQNEDSYLELRDSGLYAVADGVGGAQAGDVASQMAMEILGEAFINLQEDGDAEERMKLAIDQANGAIFQMSNDLTQLSTMATTVVALHIQANIATIGHVGDSRLYRLDPQGNLLRETQDHSVVEEEVRAGRMTPEQAAVHPSRNVISRALGADDTVEIDMKTIMFEPNTKFLVCTDGVTRHIPDEELREVLMSDDDTFIVCQQIKTLCFERGAEDNLTAVVVSVTGDQIEVGESIESLSEDLEEETVASVRPPLVDSSVLSNMTDKSEARTDNIDDQLSFEASVDESGAEETTNEYEEEILIPLHDKTSAETAEMPKPEPSAIASTPSANSVESNDIRSYRVDEESGAGLAGNLASKILWLLVGGLVGALITYWLVAGTQVPQEQPKAAPTGQNLQLTSFENSRRSVDRDPQQYIAANVSPKDAVDHYLIGRAYLIQGNFESAKSQFLKAKEKLDGAEGVDKSTLAKDVAMGLAIINDPFAQETFKKELGLSTSSESSSDGENDEPAP